MIYTLRYLFVFAVLLFSIEVSAQPKYEIGDLKFISGNWITKHQWGNMEENWSKPQGQSMIGSYRCLKDGKPVFYEFIVIEQSDSVPVMKLRHFGPGSIAWEEKDRPNEYPLAKLQTNFAKFESPDKQLSLTFKREAEDRLTVVLARLKNGKWEEDNFHYTLANK